MKLQWKIGISVLIATILVNIIGLQQLGPSQRDESILDNIWESKKDIKNVFMPPIAKPKGIVQVERHSARNHSKEGKVQVAKDYYELEAESIKEITKILNMYEEDCSKKLNGRAKQLGPPRWQNKVLLCNYTTRNHFYLTISLQVRIYKKDKAKWTVAELKQWLHYVFWMGAEHIYLCDHYKRENERLDTHLGRYIQAGLITYIPWAQTRNAMQAQVACYQHIIDKYGNRTLWQAAIDMDEYPFLPGDQKEGSITRYLKRVGFATSEISLHNYLMLGQGDRTKNMTIERITRMTPKPLNELDKPFYRPSRVSANIHHNKILHGHRVEARDEEVRLLHYWGSRWNNFRPDTPRLYNMTIDYPLLKGTLASALRQSLLRSGEFQAFSSNTGP